MLHRGIAPLLAGVLLVAANAHGAPSMSPAEARKEFTRAQSLYSKNKCSEALPKLTRLVEATGSPNAQLYVARCLRQLKQLPEAYEAYSEALRSADKQSTKDERYADTRSAAAAERAALESKVARIVIAAADAAPGLVVQVNGVKVDEDRLGDTLAIKPGKVTVTAEAPGREPFERSQEVAAGENTTFAIVLPARSQTDTPTQAPSNDPQPEQPPPATKSGGSVSTSGSSTRTLGYVALGVGAAGLATFGVAGLMANSRYSSLEDECGGGPCPASKQGDIDDGKRLDLIANIGLGVGAVGVVAGTVLVLMGGKSSKETVTVAPTRSGGFVGYSRSF
ncbi:MAG: hypothetical protein R3B13_21710 [Polyangiaceae bacterium]